MAEKGSPVLRRIHTERSSLSWGSKAPAHPEAMPTKRNILPLLTRDELLERLDRYDLMVDDRRVKDGLVEALAASRKARLDELLADLPRDRLKVLCRELDLDDSGREKAVIVERLVGAVVARLPRSLRRLLRRQTCPSRGCSPSSSWRATCGQRRTSCAAPSTPATTRTTSSGSSF